MNQEETMLKHKERYKKTIKNLTVMSDIFARNVFKDKKACEYVLRIHHGGQGFDRHRQ